MASAPHSPPLPIALVAHNLSRSGFAHGFATRAGGVSDEPFASLNFGLGDDVARIAENVRRLGEAVGFEPSALRQVTQVHGARVVDGATLADASAREEADALVLLASAAQHARQGGARAVGVRVADCVPILIGSKTCGVAAIHAGWRGVVAGVVPAALERLGGSDAVAAIGPCIGACCFEVGRDVAEKIAAAAGDPDVVRPGATREKAMVDLRRAVRRQLERAGVADVEDVPGCTRCDPARFFSYRRDGERSGRHLAVVALR